ncbi:MAG: OsmC family peroxiredoxin [Azospirillum sp.]|nr:OsmC family peroxiredoxin [Azospirillum sp.]
MPRSHVYRPLIRWTGNRGSGTSGYYDYGRDHVIEAAGKPPLPGSADPAFRGDAARWNPEDLLVASLSCCHMLWFLHLSAESGLIVTAYDDEPVGTMAETADGSGHFTSVVLRPRVTLAAGGDPAATEALHHRAHALCFIANSVNFPVTVESRFGISD